MFVKVLHDSSMSRAKVFQWHSQFAAGEEPIEDTEWNGRSGTTKTNENIAQMAAVLKDDHRANCRMIAESTGYQKPSFNELSDDLKKRKLCARFVPDTLTAEQWKQCIVHAKDLLEMIAHEPNFLDSIIPGDESWCFSYDPEMKRQSATRCAKNSQRPKKLRFQKSKIRRC